MHEVVFSDLNLEDMECRVEIAENEELKRRIQGGMGEELN
jgi:hypothetical protein